MTKIKYDEKEYKYNVTKAAILGEKNGQSPGQFCYLFIQYNYFKD